MTESIRVARKAPCPCGSGRKYKRCCGKSATADWSGDGLWHRMRAAEGRLVMEILEWAGDRSGPLLLEAAWDEFLLGEEHEGGLDEHPEFEGLFLPWFLFTWTPDADDEWDLVEDWPRKPLGLAFLDECGAQLDPLERRFLETVCSRPYSFHQVLAVERQRSLQLRDLLTGEEWTVSERSATGSVGRGAIVFTRVLPIDEVAILLGCGLYVIPPSYGPGLLDLRKKLSRGSGPISSAELRDLDADLRWLYFDIAEDLCHPPPLELRNTDGDRFELIELRYALSCTPQRAFDALKALALGHTDDELLADAELDEEGALRSISFPWLEKGNKKHKSWDNTILGNISIGEHGLTVSVNSRRRASRIRKVIRKRLGGEAAFEGESARSAQELLAAAEARDEEAERRWREEQRKLEEDPAVRELTERLRREHWKSWLDEKLPALGGMTPRKAARDPRGRERLEALLLEFEWRVDAAENPLSPDVAALRRELRLP